MWRRSVRVLVEGEAEGPLLVHEGPLSLLGDVDAETGELRARPGAKIAGRVLAISHVRGSTVGSYVLFALKEKGLGPSAIVTCRADPVLIAGCVLAAIPLAEGLSREDLRELKSLNRARLDGAGGALEAWRE
ncbi:MAG: DUF126 domain-containing protein [Fervidicoccaceae archaeon]